MILRTTLRLMALPFIVILSIATGSAIAQPPGPAPQAATVFRVRAKLTGYDACYACCGKRDGVTASGTDGFRPTGVAAANRLVPLGAYVYIEGLPENPMRLVDDTGGAMRQLARKGYLQFDVRFGDRGRHPKSPHRRALEFGTRWTEVYVYIVNPTEEQRAFFRKNAVMAWDTPLLDPEAAFAGAFERYAMASPQL